MISNVEAPKFVAVLNEPMTKITVLNYRFPGQSFYLAHAERSSSNQ